MSETLTALASENLNPSLRSLLEDVQRGHIRVPRFQRPFVWTDQQRIELLQSVRDNMPIGSLLVWRTSKFKLASFPMVGPHPIPPIMDIAPATGWQYLLDGHQRVSTLLGLLLPPIQNQESQTPDSKDESDVIDWDIQYDLHTQEFFFARKQRKKGPVRPLLPLWKLFDGRLVNKHMREMRRLGEQENWTDENLDSWEERADQLSYRFQQCRIPIVVMVTDDLSLAAKTFQRINSLGTPMDETHLVTALTWTADFDLRERISEIQSTFPQGWKKTEDSLFLQVCKGLSGLDMTKTGQSELVKKLTDDPTLLARAGNGLRSAVELLSRKAGIAYPELLPYSFQLVILAVFFATNSDAAEKEDHLMRWFWRTGWSEIFGSASFREVRSEQDNLTLAVEVDAEPHWTRDNELPARFDFRFARVRLFTLRQAARDDLVDEFGNALDGQSLLKNHGRDALVRLFAAPKGATTHLKKLLQGGGNRFFMDPTKEQILRERLRFGPDLPDDVLASHFISAEALQALRGGDLETFVASRERTMEAWDFADWGVMNWNI
jgi:hypothetical protein